MVVGSDVCRVKAFGAGKLVVNLNRSALPFAAKSVVQLELKLGSVKGSFLGLNLVIQSGLVASVGKRFFGALPSGFVANVVVGHRRKFNDQLVKAKVVVNVLEQFAELGDLRSNLRLFAKNVRVVLDKAANAHDSVQSSAWLVANVVTKLGKAQRQILVTALAALENLKRARAVHRLDGEQALFAFCDEHIFLVVAPVSAALPKAARHDRGRVDLLVAVAANHLAHVVLHDGVDCPSVGMPENLAWVFGVKVEQVHLNAKAAVVALFGLFQHLEVVLKVVGLFKSDGVNASKHWAVAVAAPIGSGKLCKLEGLRVYLFCVGHVGAAAQIGKVVLGVD